MNTPEHYAGRAAESAARAKANRNKRLSKVQTEPMCDCGNRGYWHGNRCGSREFMCNDCWLEQHRDCIKNLYSLLNQLLPQIGNATLKDYGQLNRATLLAEKLLDSD